jgi:glyoxylase I family protein
LLRTTARTWEESDVPKVTGIAHVELSVSNLDASVAWYSALLDAVEVFRAADPAERIVAAALREPRSGIVIALTQHEDPVGGRFTPRRVGLDHLSLGVKSKKALDRWIARLDALGISHSPTRDYGFGLAVTLNDPDGIALEFICPRRAKKGKRAS